MQANFFNDLDRGKVGERILANIVANKGYKISDLSDDRVYQKKGVDFRIKNDSKDVLVDVKTDYLMYKTGNIFLEIQDGPRVGWAKKTAADLIFYIDYNSNTVYVLEWDSCADKIDELRTVSFNNQDGVHMVGALLPIDKLDELQITYQVLQY